MESAKKQLEIDKKAMDELVRERDILNKVHKNNFFRIILKYF